MQPGIDPRSRQILDKKIEELLTILAGIGTSIAQYSSQPAVLVQIIIVAILLGVAFLISWCVESCVRTRADRVSLVPGVRRVFGAMIDQRGWVIFVVLSLLGILDDVASFLDTHKMSVGQNELSVLGIFGGLFVIGVMLWIASASAISSTSAFARCRN